MADRHKADAIPFRDEELVPWVKRHADYTGTTAVDILRQAAAAYRAQVEETHLVTFGSPYDPGEISR